MRRGLSGRSGRPEKAGIQARRSSVPEMRRIEGVASRSSRPTDFSGWEPRHQQLGGALSELSRQGAPDESETQLRSVRSAACSDELPFVQRDQGTRTGPLRDRNPRRNTVSGRTTTTETRSGCADRSASCGWTYWRRPSLYRRVSTLRSIWPEDCDREGDRDEGGIGYRTNPAVDLRTITVRRWGYSRATTFDSMSRGK